MANLPVFVSVEGAQRLRTLNRRLKDAGQGELRKQLRRRIRDEGKPIVAELRAAVMRVEVSSSRGGTAYPDRSTGLRVKVAKATGLSVTQTGIRFRVNSKRQPFPTAAKYLDASRGNFARWRHPVFGNTDVWVTQRGEPWFFKTINRHRRDFRRAVFRAMDDVADQIAD